MSTISRRDFLRAGGAAAAGLALAPEEVFASGMRAAKKNLAPSDKLNILGVGIGGRGASDLEAMETENIIGLCDVDWDYAGHVFDKYPKAKKFNDYRKMFDKMLDKADAVMIATADHTHSVIAADAIAAGKHVYVEKPMTLYPYESRLLTRMAKKYRVATQMGNQGASFAGTRRALNWLWNGEIGEVTRIEAYTNRPLWPQGISAPTEKVPIPKTLNWDAFIGPAKYRDYHPAYHPWNFRGWWDFGSGALGDMANHILQVAFRGLNLGYPSSILASSTMVMNDSCPSVERISFKFPARDNLPKLALPACELVWYDGKLLPDYPPMPEGKKMDGSGACIFYGTKDIMVVGCYGNNPFLCSGREPEVPELCRVVNGDDHQQDWIRACKESPESRVLTESDFSLAGPQNEAIVLGCAAVRLQPLERWLDWDGEKMEFTNIGADERIEGSVIQDNFHVVNGHPVYDRKRGETVSAREFASRLVKPVYREGWTLRELPKD